MAYEKDKRSKRLETNTSEKIRIEYIDCNYCGSKNSKILFEVMDYGFGGKETYGVVQCQDCRLVYLTPRPHPNDLDQVYPPSFFYRDPKTLMNFWDSALNKRMASKITKAPPGKLLDIGASNGSFLFYMQQNGWKVVGVEPGKGVSNVFGVNIIPGTLEAVNFPSATFDVVTAWAALEHVYDPCGLIQEISRILVPGGEFVVSVPNFDSITARMRLGDDFPRHVYFFTIDSLRNMLNVAGLDVVHHETRGDIFPASVYGVLEFQLKRLLCQDIYSYLHMKRNRERMKQRAKSSVREKIKSDGVFWTCVKLLERCVAPIVDLITIPIGLYGTLNVRAIKRRIKK